MQDNFISLQVSSKFIQSDRDSQSILFLHGKFAYTDNSSDITSE